ncbi:MULTISPECIES: replication initiation factor domain-containing protein [Bacillus cereus group]|nr:MULTISPECIES: replication initiation factor domain-containing protein [Bacillus cereus group]MCU5629357.1 replication initiation factor domain-containing protein [Bacillus cereus]RXZ05188.1 replication initiation protein [Klebsiella pneumoniae]MDK7438202.1 replication initiation factor domain-containing protein [Bacillus paranthracis]MDK7471082.1 replication initiation factor domain-containing protein [Bacillus paranthracis]MDK7487252.1 replication initiation factor domain-containing protei
MHNVLKSSLLDVTIDKLSIVADFKEGIKKEEFIRMVASSNMPYSLQANRSRNFGYEEVLKSESVDCGYIELAGELKVASVDRPKLTFHRFRLEDQIEQERLARKNGEPLLSDVEYQCLFESLADVEELIAETDEDGRLTDERKLKRQEKQVELTIEKLKGEIVALKSEIDEQELATGFKNEAMEKIHEEHVQLLLNTLKNKENLIEVKKDELLRNAEMFLQLDENGFLPGNGKKKTDRLLKHVRFEFNPKHMAYNRVVDESIRLVLGLLENVEVTGIHIACDYPVKISNLKIKDLSSKSECIFLDRDKSLGTMYVGRRGSDNHLCIYDKKQENRENDTLDQYPDVEHVTRFEARLRKKKAREWIESNYNPFDSIIVGDLVNLDDSEIKLGDRIILEAIMNDYHGRYFGMMDRFQRNTWRKKLNQCVPKMFDVAGDYEKKKVLLTGQLAELLENGKK